MRLRAEQAGVAWLAWHWGLSVRRRGAKEAEENWRSQGDRGGRRLQEGSAEGLEHGARH